MKKAKVCKISSEWVAPMASGNFHPMVQGPVCLSGNQDPQRLSHQQVPYGKGALNTPCHSELTQMWYFNWH